ncbi:c-type cytochrome [Luteimonas deserti]|uniref:Cytochrome c5 family protein n=1 Tax=Luteimonas deserti TaxID=2752306 RepID=A0A7Z0QPX9_9GAMM|nr:c-type cytochrome [Luteimonas deserti]NYZ61458.1 cytochrome c5 family protein [Luteimonas deserti]
MRNYDLEFLKRFSLVLVFLSIVTLGLIIGAWMLHSSVPTETPPNVAKRTEARIAPVGAVYAGATGAASQAAATAAAAAAAASQVAYGGTLDGGTIYQNLCAGCHTSGAGGAPTLVRAQWAARLAQGTETLYRHSIEGFVGEAGVMPARGGNPALSDEQMQVTVDWMVDNLK